MGLIDDLTAPVPLAELSRRKLLGTTTGVALGIAGIGSAITTIRYLRPNVLFEPATKFSVGRPDQIPLGTLIVLSAQNLYVGHVDSGFFAMSAVCTHLGCMTRFDGKEISCPCHGSRFDNQGHVAQGPAPIPLRRLELSLKDGELFVDTRKSVSDDFVLEV